MLFCEYGLHASVANLLHPNTLHDDLAENLNRIRSCKVDEMSGVQSFPRQKYCFAWRGPHLLLSATCIQRNWEKAYLVVPPSGRRSLLHPSITHSHSQSRSVAPPGISGAPNLTAKCHWVKEYHLISPKPASMVVCADPLQTGTVRRGTTTMMFLLLRQSFLVSLEWSREC